MLVSPVIFPGRLALQSSMATTISPGGSASVVGDSFEGAAPPPDSRATLAAGCPCDFSDTDDFAVADGDAFGDDLSLQPQANTRPATHIHATALRILITTALLSHNPDEKSVAGS